MQATEIESVPGIVKPPVAAGARLDFLDALRGVAALLVVIQHVGERYTNSIPWFAETWFSFGRLGVTIFFLVSGFVIPYAFEKDASVRSFWVKRIFRLYPLYWLSLSITLIAKIEPADFPMQHVISYALVNATMLQGFVGVPNASAPYWTLFIEMAFYIAFTVWFVTKWHKKTMLWAWMGAVAFLAVSVVAPLLRGTHAPATKLFCFLAILVGSAWYRCFTNQVSNNRLALLIAAVVILAGAGAYLNFARFPSSEHISATSVFLSWAAAFLLFGIAFAFRGHAFPGLWTWLGKISYSLYLLHAVVLDTMPNFANRAAGFAAVLAVSLVLSFISFRWLESPFISLGHRVARTIRGRSTVGTG